MKRGNKVAVGSENSPQLNADNTADDRQIVIGNKCLNISDKVPFTRQVYQTIASTPCVPIIDGTYTLRMKVKSSNRFSQLYVYAKSGGTTFKKDIHESDSKWHELTLDDIIVTRGSVEVGIMADGPAQAWCHIDDLELVRDDNRSDRMPHN